MIKKKIGPNIKKYREQNGYTQSELGFYMGVAKQTISSWESDRTQPDAFTLKHLASVLNTDVDSLMDETPSESSDTAIIRFHNEQDKIYFQKMQDMFSDNQKMKMIQKFIDALEDD